MKENVTLPIGSISIVEKIEKDFGLVSGIFDGISGRSKEFKGIVKLLLVNRIEDAVSVHQILPTSSIERFELLGMKKAPSERSIYRCIEKVGRTFPAILDRYQRIIERQGLVDDNQIADFSSSYFEGEKAQIAEFGYSRDHRPDKKQVTWGISTGINGIPTALTIQKGNVQDKAHMREMLTVCTKILDEGSLIMFDCGGNSPWVKDYIVKNGFNYTTLRAKKVKTYKRQITGFEKGCKRFELNGKEYLAIKKKSEKREGEFIYAFFSKDLCEDQLRKKESKFRKKIEYGDQLAKKAGKRKAIEKMPSSSGWVCIYPEIQKTLHAIGNPYINGIEGFFILESSIDEEPEKILALYKQRDVAEKFIRSMKEGGELRPIRHWNKYAIIGTLFICFLASAIINLTEKFSTIPLVKNFKLLKTYLKNLTLTIIYPKNAFRIRVLCNFLPEIRAILGDFPLRYADKNLDLRW